MSSAHIKIERKKTKYPKPPDGIELIQQWQYMGRVHPKLWEDQAFENCQRAGITSVQSYVTWAEIEKARGNIDFSTYDPLVEKLLKHNIKWVPYLILGPYYATPRWFQESPASVYAKCLEHNKECKIQSIWNPHLPYYVKHFLDLFARHYNNHGLFESITLGISGNWGESIYPAFGCFLGGFHVHPGWWCGDEYAWQVFRTFAMTRYGSLDAINARWGTNFKRYSQVTFPKENSILKDLYYQAIKAIPKEMKPYLKKIKNRWIDTVLFRLNQTLAILKKSSTAQTPEELQRRVDFVQWYQDSMTNWAEFWIKAARKRFPMNEIYLVAGGRGEPILGADLTAQVKVAKKNNSGIRITNQNDNYSDSFILTRLVSAASRNYRTYFTTEEAGINSAHGVTMRIFDAVSSGAKGAYFKSVIGTGEDACSHKRISPGEFTQGAENLRKYLKFFSMLEPIIEIAVLYPNTSIAVNPTSIDSLYNQCSQLRSLLDFDLIDEHMIADGHLENYRFLIIVSGKWLEEHTLSEIKNWIVQGGVFISASHLSLSTINPDAGIKMTLSPHAGGISQIKQGFKVGFNGKKKDYLRFISAVIRNEDRRYPWKPAIDITAADNGHYFAKFPRNILFYDPIKHTIHTRKRQDSCAGQ